MTGTGQWRRVRSVELERAALNAAPPVPAADAGPCSVQGTNARSVLQPAYPRSNVSMTPRFSAVSRREREANA